MKEVTLGEDAKYISIVYRFLKRLFDLICSFFGCILLVPISLIIKIVYICNKDFDSIFFIQKRIGKNGKEFNLYKFRTMVPNAEEVLQKWLNEDNNEYKEEYLKNKKLENDPRITKIGNFLRKTSLDETPQFINVLLGQMSMVGPRPYLAREIEDMGSYYPIIIKVKPGLSGLWQVNGRSNIGFQRRCALDEKYVEEKSILLDLKICIKTVIQVFKKDGAK